MKIVSFIRSVCKSLFASVGISILLMLTYALVIGWATFIEKDYGTLVANDVIYRSWWFESLNVWLLINILGCMYVSVKRGVLKVNVLVFHLSLVVIIIGAGITRHFGFDGKMTLQSNQTSSFVTSSDRFLNVLVSNEVSDKSTMKDINASESFKQGYKISLSPYVRYSSFSLNTQAFEKNLKIKSIEVINYSLTNLYNETLQSGKKLEDIDEDILDSKMKENHYVAQFEVEYDGVVKKMILSNAGEIAIERFNNRFITLSWGPKFILLPFALKLDRFEVQTYPGSRMESSFASYVEVIDNDLENFEYKIYMNHVLDYRGYRFFQSEYNVEKDEKGMTKRDENGNPIYNATILSVNNDPGKVTTYIGYMLMILGAVWLLFDSNSRFKKLSHFLKTQRSLGVLVPMILCFSLFLESGWALDSKNTESVFIMEPNKQDGWTPEFGISIESRQSKNTQNKSSSKKEEKQNQQNQDLVTLLKYSNVLKDAENKLEPLMNDTSERAIQKRVEALKNMPQSELKKFASIQMQSIDGRIKLLDTFSDEIMRKVTGRNEFNGLEHNEFLLALMSIPQDIVKLRLIRVKSPEIRKILGVTDSSYVSFEDLFFQKDLPGVYQYAITQDVRLLSDFQNAYKLYHFSNIALKKKESDRSEFDKEILKIDEKMDILLPFSIWNYLRIFPPENRRDVKDKMQSQSNAMTQEEYSKTQKDSKDSQDKQDAEFGMQKEDSKSAGSSVDSKTQALEASDSKNQNPPSQKDKTWKALGNPTFLDHSLARYFYYSFVIESRLGIALNQWENFNNSLDLIHNYQTKNGGDLLLNSNRIRAELFLNSTNVFSVAQYIYLICGILLFFISLLAIIINRNVPRSLGKILYCVLFLVFLAHTLGLILRWYIGGHAPWSNAYESMLYIAWASALSGIIILRRSYFALCGASFLAGLSLVVAHWGFMDPYIGNLQPVLQSYWLNIHVAVIVASYGFLGLSLMLGIINLILFIFRSATRPQIDKSIFSLTAINEMSMIIGILMLISGTFLGGVWANESWGRYWSWDSKETWSLASVGVYACVLHVRLLKPVYLPYIFNVLSIIAFYVIIMTYFGVNYYLATGMHSYGRGQGDTISTKIFISIVLVFILALLSFFKRKLVVDKAIN